MKTTSLVLAVSIGATPASVLLFVSGCLVWQFELFVSDKVGSQDSILQLLESVCQTNKEHYDNDEFAVMITEKFMKTHSLSTFDTYVILIWNLIEAFQFVVVLCFNQLCLLSRERLNALKSMAKKFPAPMDQNLNGYYTYGMVQKQIMVKPAGIISVGE